MVNYSDHAGFIIDTIDRLRKDINKHNVDWFNNKKNIIKMYLDLKKISATNYNDPFFHKIHLYADEIRKLLLQIKDNPEGRKGFFFPKSLIQCANDDIDQMHEFLDRQKEMIVNKLKLPLGNNHIRNLYHPSHPNSERLRPSTIPADYRSNFFMELYVKELSTSTALITFHPYHESQMAIQDKRSFQRLSHVNFDIDFDNPRDEDDTDNIICVRIHGPGDNKSYPGSYIVVVNGHHRLRSLFKMYLDGKIKGDKKIVVQLAQHPSKDIMASAKKKLDDLYKARIHFMNL